MKKYIFIAFVFIINTNAFAQTPGYYNGTENIKGEELKTALHNIINNHVDFSYSDAKFILNYADEDPNNTNNLIQLYTNRSVSKDSWGTGGDQTNREHVWAKSHGDFADVRPMDGDAHNLHAADASVNVTRSNYDFDEVTDGTYIEEADAYYGGEAFEPADRDKGVIARTLFYMAVRYEGTNNEIDLQMVDAINTADGNTHGKLSTLLKWNRDFPPTEMEKRRNERVFQSQLNRNPFIDHPEFADLIWDNGTLPATKLGNMNMAPKNPKAGENVNISLSINSTSTLPTTKLYWGNSYNSETHETNFTGTDDLTATLSLAGFLENELVYIKAVTSSGEELHASFYVAPNKTLTSITDIQGKGNASPMVNSNVTVAGVVTANFDNSFYLQSGNDIRSGLCIYSNWRGKIGDSVVVTGDVIEYQNLTEISEVSMVYSYGESTQITPTTVSISDLDEDYEGMLIKLSDVNFSNADELITPEGGTYTINEGSQSITVYARYNSRLTGQRIPNGTVDVTAILSQYKDNYQLLIDNINWINQGIDITAPEITSAVTTDATYIEVTFNEKINAESVNAAAFSIEGLTIEDAYFYPSTSVFLLVSGLQKKEYTLVVNGIEDLYGNATANATFTFTSDFESGINDKNNPIFTILPNPSDGKFRITFDESQSNKTVWISDLSGRIVKKLSINTGVQEQEIELSNITKGCYLVHIDSLGKRETQKIIIQ